MGGSVKDFKILTNHSSWASREPSFGKKASGSFLYHSASDGNKGIEQKEELNASAKTKRAIVAMIWFRSLGII